MKSIYRYTIGLFFMSALIMSGGCIMEQFEEEVDNAAQGLNTIGYMAVRLTPTDGGDTRASVGDEFNVGSTSEFALSNDANHYAIFYSADSPTPIALGELNGMSVDQSMNSGANSSVVFATIVGRNEMKEVLMRYADCYVILNTYLSRADIMNCTKEDLLGLKVASPYFFDSKGARYFTMCNSVYVENGQKKIFTEVDTDKIYQSYNETMEQAWKGNAAVNAYVERLAARFAVTFDNEAYNAVDADRIFTPEENNIIVFTQVTNNGVPFYSEVDPQTNTPYSYKIRITGWSPNALEQISYLFRNFNPTGGYFTGWTNTAYKRVFWSEDLNYRKAVYPWQYRRVIDNTNIPVYQDKVNILQNLSFNELEVNAFGGMKLYAPENTYDYTDEAFASALNYRPELLAGTHIIVCAELLTNIDNPNSWDALDLYRDRTGLFYKSELDCALALVNAMNNILESHTYLKFTYWDWTKGGVEEKLYVDTKGDYALYYDGKKLDSNYIRELYAQGVSLTAPAEFKGSDGKRILWNDKLTIRDSGGKTLETYSNIDEVNSKNNVKLRPSTVNDIKSAIFENLGAVDHFNNGKMYYAVPIGYYKDNVTGNTGINDKYSIYGVVRNSSYEIKIRNVGGIGTSVDNLDEPIVPNTVNTNDHLYFGLKILNWHPFETTVPGDIK